MITNIFSVILLLLGLGGMLGSITWILRRGKNSRLTRLFIFCQLSIVMWLISQLLILFSESARQLWISYIIGNIGISCFAPLWLMFSAEYVGAGARILKLTRLLPVISVSSICLVVTNPLHRLYYTTFGESSKEYAALFYIFQAIYYVCIITGITMMCVRHSRAKDQITKQSILLTLSTAVPLAVNTLTLTGAIRSKIELTPLFFAFSSILIIIAVGKYGLLNINSIAIRDTIENISSGIVIFDIDGTVSFKNRSANTVSGLGSVRSFDDILALLSAAAGRTVGSEFSSEEIVLGEEHFSFRQSFCENRSGDRVARVVTIANVTEYHELAEAEKKLSIEQERNRIAQEMHDSAGHTFTMISSLAKLLKFETEKPAPDTNEMLRNIKDIDGLSRNGVTQLRCTINSLRDDEFMTSVTKAINTVISAARTIETELCVQGEEDERYGFCIKTIYDNCRESVTNAVRYSEADRIDIIVKFLGDRLELYILDNGKGCENIEEHNGLRGIRERTEALGGSVRFSSVMGEGFNTIIKIPVGDKK